MISDTAYDDFHETRRTPKLPLAINDVVSVTHGERIKSRAWVISIYEENPVPVYLVEFDDGSDAMVPLTAIKFAPSSDVTKPSSL